ncbi:hypothetical protein HanPSC8_Chr02g0057651 [Helianthus annuus]|nr:hypothetical protein HanHA89_Chr02g0051731 [Helianthus annuus]KAJ0776773.1 hypothetical protein HanLR1_Chr02g0049481 [Helianthus annuus]KAJ0951240.1 hypothetical protein HanPSC8_Chr02g0057651 [Helianthus annuus]
MEVDPATAEDKFVPDWDVENKDSVMDVLTAKMFLFGINTPVGHSRSRRMKSQDLGMVVLANQAQSNVYVVEVYRRWVEANSVRENMEKKLLFLKKQVTRTPVTEKKLAQLSQDLIVLKEMIKSLPTLNHSAWAAVASTYEERNKTTTELAGFVTTMKEKDEAHKDVLTKMEESLVQACNTYDRMIAGPVPYSIFLASLFVFFLTCFTERDLHKSGEGNLKARMEVMEKNHGAEVKDLKLENADLNNKVEELRVTKVWLLTEGAQLLAKHVHKRSEMT